MKIFFSKKYIFEKKKYKRGILIKLGGVNNKLSFPLK